MSQQQGVGTSTRARRQEKKVGQSKSISKGNTKMMDETLTILSLEPIKMVTKLNRESLRAREESVPRRNQEVSQTHVFSVTDTVVSEMGFFFFAPS